MCLGCMHFLDVGCLNYRLQNDNSFFQRQSLNKPRKRRRTPFQLPTTNIFITTLLKLRNELIYIKEVAKMKEAIVHPGPTIKIIDSPIPEPGDDQVVTRVVVSGSNPKDWYVHSFYCLN
jgi:hypothetical protein